MKRSFASGRSSVRCRSEMKGKALYFLGATSVIDSMMTGWRGVCSPPGPAHLGLGDLVTTSIPSTTLPNTA